MIFFKGDYKTNWLVMVVIFCSVVVITSSRPQEQETTNTTFSFFKKKKKANRSLNHWKKLHSGSGVKTETGDFRFYSLFF